MEKQESRIVPRKISNRMTYSAFSSDIIFSTYKFFFHFIRSTHNILSKYLKFYPKCKKSSAIIFPKFLSRSLRTKLFKILDRFTKICPYFSLTSTKIFLNISFSKFSPNLLQRLPTLLTFTN